MTLSVAVREALRSQTEGAAQVRWYLALAPYGDPTFTAQVNDAAIARGERDIVYDNDAGEGNILVGFTLWVGSTSGAYDIGKVRIKAIDTGTNTITVAENDDIEWADDLHISCPGEDGFRELWGVLPRITEAGGVVTFYEDYDEAYNDPVDDVIPPKANAGPPVCDFLGTDGSVWIEFYGSPYSFTTETGAAIASYTWDFADGVIVAGGVNNAGTEAAPNVISFTTPGFRYVSLTVTDNTAQARTGTVYIPVWIFDRTNEPPLTVEVLGQEARPSWNLRVRAFETNSTATEAFNDYPDGALCVLFTETLYPDGAGNVSGSFEWRENIRFVGWLEGESLTFNYEAGTVDFTAISHDAVMRRLPGFAYTMEDDATPSDWYEINDLNVDRALHAHLERRSTVNQVCHVETLGEGNNRDIAIQGFEDGSVYAQAQNHLLSDAMVTILSDRQGVLKVRRDPQMMDNVDRAAVEVLLTITNDDWMNDIDEMKPHPPRVGLVRMGGFSYETPLLSQAPGTAPTQSESTIYKEGYIVEDQTELNLWSGCTWKKGNLDFPQVPMEMIGYWPVFDPADQEFVRITITDPLSRNAWTNKDFIVRGVTFRDLMLPGTCRTELLLEEENVVQYGETQTIPTAPTPAPREYNPPPGPVSPPNFCGGLEKVILRTNQGIFITNNFNELVPGDVIWEASNNNLSATQQDNIVDMAFDYNDGERLFMVVETYDNTMAMADKGVFRNADIFGIAAWEQRFSGQWVQDYLCITDGQPNCGVGSGACPDAPDPPYQGSNSNACIGVFRAIGCDPVTGQIGMIGGAEDPFNATKSCRCYGIGFYSADALATLTMAVTDFKHGSHLCVWQPRDFDGGHLTSSGGVMLYTYGCAWSPASDRHRAYSLDGGNTIITDGPGEVFGDHFSLWHTRADTDVIFYTTELGSGNGDDIAISADGGVTFTVWADLLTDHPQDSGQALTLHFMDTDRVMMIGMTAGVIYYSTDGGFTWGACASQDPDEPYCIAACADPSWPIPDGYGFITGANQPADDDNWVFLTRDQGQTWENRTGNLGEIAR